jgi:hypothetical protein
VAELKQVVTELGLVLPLDRARRLLAYIVAWAATTGRISLLPTLPNRVQSSSPVSQCRMFSTN